MKTQHQSTEAALEAAYEAAQAALNWKTAEAAAYAWLTRCEGAGVPGKQSENSAQTLYVRYALDAHALARESSWNALLDASVIIRIGQALSDALLHSPVDRAVQIAAAAASALAELAKAHAAAAAFYVNEVSTAVETGSADAAESALRKVDAAAAAAAETAYICADIKSEAAALVRRTEAAAQ